MTSKPLISVVIPFYNSGRLLNEALSSLNRQTFKDFEIIVVNDGSTENESLKVLLGLKDSGVRLFNKKNGGLSSARNHGIRRAKGEFIMPLDADDTLDSKYFEKTVPLFTNLTIGFVYTHAKLFGKVQRVWKTRPFDIPRLLRFCYVPAWSIMRRKVWEDVGGYDETMIDGCEDWDFWLSSIEKGWKGKQLPEALYNYRIHSKNMSVHTTKMLPEIVKYLRTKHNDLYDKYPISSNRLVNQAVDGLFLSYYKNKARVPIWIRESGKNLLSQLK